MGKTWTDIGWDEYLHWQNQDRKTLKKINRLMKEIMRTGDKGLGKPELLSGDMSGWRSRRIDEKNRLIYRVSGETIEISHCRGHYE
ncbi:MAG: Txe/YoeB family addiction module toxin [Treponema sp.]|jgi:toxin YoeB|nr:Txe/YoeB family addiction module toxin [Treponema sp.]